MKEQYLRHCLLKNPAQYLKCSKQHTPSLYKEGFYTLAGNPFADLLADTRANANTRFPVGNMLKLTVNDDKKVIPVINDNVLLSRVYYTSLYILNNRRFLDAVQKDGSWRRYVPRKIQQRQTTDKPVGFVDGISNLVSVFYRTYIRDLLKDCKGSQGQGILLVTSGEILRFMGSTPVINIRDLLGEDCIQDEVHVSYESNPELCKLLIHLVNFER